MPTSYGLKKSIPRWLRRELSRMPREARPRRVASWRIRDRETRWERFEIVRAWYAQLPDDRKVACMPYFPFGKQRHARFARAFMERLTPIVMQRGKLPRGRALMSIAADAFAAAGWRMPTRKADGTVTGVVANRARDIITSPQMSHAWGIELSNAGLTPTKCAEVISEIASDGEAAAADRLRAVDMAVKLTTGYAPTKSANVQIHARADKFFDPRVFESTPPPALDPEPS